MIDFLFVLIVIGALICALTGAGLLVRDAERRQKHRKLMKKGKNNGK